MFTFILFFTLLFLLAFAPFFALLAVAHLLLQVINRMYFSHLELLAKGLQRDLEALKRK